MIRSALLGGACHKAMYPNELGMGGGLRLGLGLGLGGGGGGGGAPAGAMSFGINLHDFQSFSGARPYTNLAQSNFWRADEAPNNTILEPNVHVNALGDLILCPVGKTVTRSFHPADATGTTPLVMWWLGSPTGPTIAGTATAPGTITGKAGGYYREFTQTDTVFTRSNAWVNIVESTLTGDKTVRNLIIVEKSIFDDPAYADPRDIPVWYSGLVSEIIARNYRRLRFMDLMETNDSGMSVMTWPNRAQINNSATLMRRNAFHHWTPGGVFTQSFTIAAKEFWATGSETYFGTKTTAPLNPFGANGNMIAFVFNAPSGAGSVSVNSSTPGEVVITVTEPLATPGAASIITLLNASTDAQNWIDTSPWSQLDPGDAAAWGNNAGTTAIGPVAKTFLAHGMDALAQDGCPIEWMVDLANQTMVDPWFPMPYQADETYVRSFWAYVETNLHPSLTPYVEVGNEVWNFNFLVFRQNQALADRAGLTIQQYRAQRHQQVMGWARAECPRVMRVLATQSAGPSDYTSLLAVPGTAAATDVSSQAPYIAYNQDMEDVPSLTTDPDVIFDRIEANHIWQWIDFAVVNKATADAQVPPHIFEPYEWQQHMISFINASTFNTIQAHPRMQRLISIALSGINRLATPVNINFYGDFFQINNTTGAWGLKPTILDDDADCPKLQAMLKAQQGLFAAYFDRGDLPEITGTFNVGQTVTIVLPTAYNVAAQEVRLYAGATLLGTDIEDYVLTSGEVGEDLTVQVDLTGTDGQTHTYTSETFGPVEAFEKIDIWTPARLASNGGVITLPADWTADNEVHCWGSGGNGFVSTTGGNYRSGGGGRAYSASTDIAGLTPGGSITATIGAAGGTTNTSFNSGAVVAAYAANGANVVTTGGGAGGAAGSGTGTVKYSGGAGGGVGATFAASAGGGGDAGPTGAGKAGAAMPTGSVGSGGGGSNGGSSTAGSASAGLRGGDGGNGTSGTGHGVGADGSVAATNGTNGGGGAGGWNTTGKENGSNGGQEVLFTDTVTPSRVEGPWGGGGGCAPTATATGGTGGGGGGSRAAGGLGKDGSIVLVYRP